MRRPLPTILPPTHPSPLPRAPRSRTLFCTCTWCPSEFALASSIVAGGSARGQRGGGASGGGGSGGGGGGGAGGAKGRGVGVSWSTCCARGTSRSWPWRRRDNLRRNTHCNTLQQHTRQHVATTQGRRGNSRRLYGVACLATACACLAPQEHVNLWRVHTGHTSHAAARRSWHTPRHRAAAGARGCGDARTRICTRASRRRVLWSGTCS